MGLDKGRYYENEERGEGGTTTISVAQYHLTCRFAVKGAQACWMLDVGLPNSYIRICMQEQEKKE